MKALGLAFSPTAVLCTSIMQLLNDLRAVSMASPFIAAMLSSAVAMMVIMIQIPDVVELAVLRRLIQSVYTTVIAQSMHYDD
jgi:hypothetical protein